MDYLKEHTFLGSYGHFLIILGFVTALTSAISYYFTLNKNTKGTQEWRLIARSAYMIKGLCLLTVVGIIFFMIFNHYFEYNYIWKYTNRSMPTHYLISSFWSGQEGSFLLWSFWIMVLSYVFKHKFSQWESPVFAITALVQAFIFSMLLGVYIGDVKIGNSPFILIRELPANIGEAWTKMPDYMLKVQALSDGTGLNPLLQNYWMVIHPPVLFLGFAATLFPFALAVAGIWKKEKDKWLNPAILCGVFAMMTLGAGILMGGAWAYESLSFGGFWAWDPVENASLVPWVILTAGVHMMLICRKKKKSYFIARLLVISSFVLVLYSSFLTRSGILGESSVHSFTENGLLFHLFTFLFFFTILGFSSLLNSTKTRITYLSFCLATLTFAWVITVPGYMLIVWVAGTIGFLVYAYEKQSPKDLPEDSILSREFWILVATLVMITAALQIILSTSVPLINNLFNTQFDAHTDLNQRNLFYSLWQVPFGIVLCFLIGISQFLQYQNTNFKWLIRKISTNLLLALLLAMLVAYLISYDLVNDFRYLLLMFTAFFAVLSNGAYIINVIKGQFDQWGAAIAHIGFGLLIAGALISASGRTPISVNQNQMDLKVLDENFLNSENVMLRKGDTVAMGDYFISYESKHQEDVNLYYKINYFEQAKKDESVVPGKKIFSLYPFIQLNEQFGNVSEPGTKHYISHDIFTHIKWADVTMRPDENGKDDDFMDPVIIKMHLGKQYRHENHLLTFHDIYILADTQEKADLGYEAHDVVVQADILVHNYSDPHKEPILVQPAFAIRDSTTIERIEVYSKPINARFTIVELPNEPNTIELAIEDSEYLVMQALLFPGMNILWAGCCIMILGCFMVVRKRWKEKSTPQNHESAVNITQTEKVKQECKKEKPAVYQIE
jgi:cytochrome c-type biogenesis protein CcmF